MNKKYLYILSILALSIAGKAQQIPVYTLQEMVRTGMNPAYTGMEEISDVVLLTRQQWVGFDGAPTSYYLSAHAPLQNKKVGVGFDFQRTTTGPFSQNGIFLSYAYTVRIAESSSLSFGLRGGISNYQILYNNLTVIDPGDQLFETNLENRIAPNLGTGLHFVHKHYFIDFSIPLLLRNEFSPDRESRAGLQNKEDRIYNFQAGATFNVVEGVGITPALALWLIEGAPALIDIRISTQIKDAAGFGLVYRISGSFGGFVSYKITDNFVLGYAYELPLSHSYQLSSGTHEVVLGLDFQFLNRKTQSPRRF